MSRVDMYGGRRATYSNRGLEPAPEATEAVRNGKRTKASVRYGISTDSVVCGDCKNFLQPHACRLVMGDISPAGWCKLWEKKR